MLFLISIVELNHLESFVVAAVVVLIVAIVVLVVVLHNCKRPQGLDIFIINQDRQY